MTPRQWNLGVFSYSKPIAKTPNLLLALMNKNTQTFTAVSSLEDSLICHSLYGSQENNALHHVSNVMYKCALLGSHLNRAVVRVGLCQHPNGSPIGLFITQP